MRRYELATALAAEDIANRATVMRTNASSVSPAESPADFASIELRRNATTILPEGWDLTQVKPEHPAQSLEMFIRQLLMHFCRSMNFPYGLAAGTSKDSNFSSHKGDIRNLWQSEVWVEQEILECQVLDVIFRWFLEDAVFVPGLLDGMPSIDDIGHAWFWDGIPPLDETDATNAAQTRVSTGQSTLLDEYAANGRDFEAAMARADASFGLTPGTYKRAVLIAQFPHLADGAAMQAASPAVSGGATGGEYTEISQRAFNNNQRRIRSTLKQFAAGDITETMARVTLRTIGLDAATIDDLIADAGDGSIDNPELAEAVE